MYVTYSCHSEIFPKHPSALPTYNTSVLYLCEARIAMHLCELQLGRGACSLREGGVTYYVS